jgi:hypothetical protein
MLIPRSDGKGFDCGVYDVLCVLYNVHTGLYHVCFLDGGPLAGSADFVRLKSVMHHTEGARTFYELADHLAEMVDKIYIDHKNISDTPIGWDGCTGHDGFVWIVSNWLKAGIDICEALASVGIPISQQVEMPRVPISVKQID